MTKFKSDDQRKAAFANMRGMSKEDKAFWQGLRAEVSKDDIEKYGGKPTSNKLLNVSKQITKDNIIEKEIMNLVKKGITKNDLDNWLKERQRRSLEINKDLEKELSQAWYDEHMKKHKQIESQIESQIKKAKEGLVIKKDVVKLIHEQKEKEKDLMDNRFVKIPLEHITTFLEYKGFKGTKRDNSTEWSFNKIVYNSSGIPYLMRVYTSASKDKVREKGKDAFRVGVFDSNGEWMFGDAPVRRTENWRDNLIDRMNNLEKRIKGLK